MRLIDADALRERIIAEEDEIITDNAHAIGLHNGLTLAHAMLINAPTIEAEPVRHGRWKCQAHSFHVDTFDESEELCVYITGHCSECGTTPRDNKTLFSRSFYEPRDYDLLAPYKFDRNTMEQQTLKQFLSLNIRLPNYCPNCGAKMDKEEIDNDSI